MTQVPVKCQKLFRAPIIFQGGAKHKQSEHIKKYVSHTAIGKHVRNNLEWLKSLSLWIMERQIGGDVFRQGQLSDKHHHIDDDQIFNHIRNSIHALGFINFETIFPVYCYHK